MQQSEVPQEALNQGEIVVPGDQILRHVFRTGESYSSESIFTIIPTSQETPPTFTKPFYHANIGTPKEPQMLELRFEPTDHGFWIALLMTNERFPRDLEVMASQIMQRLNQRGIEYDAVLAPESLGPKLGNEIARLRGPEFPVMSLQKGKPQIDSSGNISVGPPKAWITMDSGIEVTSGTSHPGARQMLFLDPKWAEVARHQQWSVLVVDDARLTGGTLESSLALAKKMGLRVVAAATVLNEADPVEYLNNIPYIWLTKLPLFDGQLGNLQPRQGTFDGLDNFYIEQG